MNETAESELLCGAAMVDITPWRGVQLGGDIGRRRPAEFVNDPIHARALVLQSGEARICLLSLELIGASGEAVASVQQRAAERFGFVPESVMVHSLQIHSTPGLGFYLSPSPFIPPDAQWLREGDSEYTEWATDQIMSAIETAVEQLEPVTVSYASGIDARWAFNRRFVMRDGKVLTHPRNGDPRIRYAEGPMDPEVGVVCFTAEDLRVPAILLHYTCHPCHGYPHRYVSADWPGAWAEGVQAFCGADCVPLVINGLCGNIHHRNHLDAEQVDDYRLMGDGLTETAVTAIKRGMTQVAAPRLAWRAAHVRLPYRDIDSAVDWAREYLEQNPEPVWQDEQRVQCSWDWVHAVTLMALNESRRRDNGVFDCPLQVFRIGDIALVSFPGEPFVEGQLRLKVESPTYPTYAAHNCSNEPGYIPTQHAFPGGGYETEWGDLQPDALDAMVDAAAQALHEMFE